MSPVWLYNVLLNCTYKASTDVKPWQRQKKSRLYMCCSRARCPGRALSKPACCAEGPLMRAAHHPPPGSTGQWCC